MNGKTLKVITFDLDDSLWDIVPVIARAEARLHAWFAVHYPRVAERFSPRDLQVLRQQAGLVQPQLAHDLTALRKHSLRVAFEQAGYGADGVEDAFAVFWAARNDVMLHADVVPALEALVSRYTLGTISNGNADVGLAGLGRFFAFSISAARVGAAKPAARIFHAACTAAGVAPDAVAHIGDDPDCDIRGAREAGLHAVWLNRDGRQWPLADARPTLTVANLLELSELLLAH